MVSSPPSPQFLPLAVIYTLYSSVSNALPITSYMKAIEWWLLFFILVHFFIYLVHAFKEFADRQTSTRPQSMEKVDRSSPAVDTELPELVVIGIDEEA